MNRGGKITQIEIYSEIASTCSEGKSENKIFVGSIVFPLICATFDFSFQVQDHGQQPSSFPLPEYAAVKPFCIHVSLFLNTLICDCGTLKQHHIKACSVDYSQHMDVLHINYIFALVWRESK